MAGGLFAGDENMHVQGHPYESSSYHKAFFGAASFETLPVHYSRPGYVHGYFRTGYAGHSCCGHYGYPRYGYGYRGHSCCGHRGYAHGGCGCKHGCGSFFGKYKRHFNWGHGCCGHQVSDCGCQQDACGCEQGCCHKPCCLKSLFNFGWLKKGCGCGCSADTCDSCGCGESHDVSFPEAAEEVMPEPVEETKEEDAAPVLPPQSSAQFRSVLPPVSAVLPTSLFAFPF